MTQIKKSIHLMQKQKYADLHNYAKQIGGSVSISAEGSIGSMLFKQSLFDALVLHQQL